MNQKSSALRSSRSGNICAPTTSPTASSTTSKPSSTPPATHGENSSPSRSRSHQSECGPGRMRVICEGRWYQSQYWTRKSPLRGPLLQAILQAFFAARDRHHSTRGSTTRSTPNSFRSCGSPVFCAETSMPSTTPSICLGATDRPKARSTGSRPSSAQCTAGQALNC